MGTKKFAEKFIKAEEEAFKGNFVPLEAIDAPDVIWHLLARNYDIVGFEAHKQYLGEMRKISSNAKAEWKYLAGEGNIFALSFKADIPINNNIGSAGDGTMFARSVKAAGGLKNGLGSVKEMTMSSIQFFRLNQGKIVEVWTNGGLTVKEK
jgi:hypothetical protein